MAPQTRENPFQVADDAALVARLLAGDEDAFDEFFNGYFGGLYRFAITRLRDEETTREVVQSTITKAIEALDRYRGEATLFTWMCGICRHEISAVYRQRKRAPLQLDLVEETPEIRAALDTLAFETEGPEDELRRKELARQVHLALDHLPPRYGQALEWKYFEGLPVAEIAARLHIGPKAAESVLSRAREAFRTGFESLGKSLGDPRRGLRLVAAKRSS
ncbi:MAG: sigma-70 family RNA polymerase sigma factor [Thermoanaerobaculia bacterium]|nr:sigma-70 family RNA polymerase sigma factor [Thermoanaerobaculia bacterium]